MKIKFFLLCLLIATSTLLPLWTAPAFSQPSKGTSAYAAARLKNHPPKNWIRHYLGDDRYKIAGGVWKVVSTELDRYYYPAWAPEMLRQPAGLVIGFSSAEQAEEAGYLPSAYPMGVSLYGLTSAEIAAARRRAVAASAAQGRRITLADGRSTVILPNGWTHQPVGTQNVGTHVGGASFQMDLLSSPGGKGGISFVFMNVPGQGDIEKFLTPQGVEQLRQRLRQRAGSDGSVASALEGAQLGTATLGGLRGLTIIPGKGAKLPAGMAGRLTIVGRGSKMYMMVAQLSPKDTQYGTVVNSFQPR